MSDIPIIGTETADEIYLAVGSALSYWEGAEDELLGLFRTIQADQPEKIAAYIKATRGPRAQMMASALRKRAQHFQEDEAEKLDQALNALGALAQRRNEIGHGHCTKTQRTVDGVTVMSGHYLVPAWNELGPVERDMRFALTVVEIKAFEDAVRDARWTIIEVAHAVLLRKHEAQQKLMTEKLRAEGLWP